ncbi:helix-turn-helix domain-containing protein [Streptomyces scabiei]|uniref:helix-turn-helix domain-containing protein n=1 Tax=Streptomyces scabiei TaxID=1930 RepID=UPI003790FC22
MDTTLMLRTARINRGLSLPAAAAKAGMTVPQLSNAERGKAGLSVKTLYRLAGVVGLDELAKQLKPFAGDAA